MSNDINWLIGQVRYFSKMTDPDVVSDDTITGFARLGEERISDELRIADMLQIDTALFPPSTTRVKLPTDFRDMDFIRWSDVDGGKPINWLNRDDFYVQDEPQGFYTTSGLFLMVGGSPGNHTVEMHYFGDVPVTDSETWLSKRYPRLLLAATMEAAAAGFVEFDGASLWEGVAADTITKLNDAYRRSIAKGSKLSRFQKGFG